jgi:Cu/Ag efflux protein CusF
LAVVLLTTVASSPVRGNEPESDPNAAAKPEGMDNEYFSGTIKSVDTEKRLLEVMNFWSTKSFSLADHCRVRLETKDAATMAELLPGHRVKVAFQEVEGVRVASEVAQHYLQYEGKVVAIDTDKGTLSVKRGWFSREFKVPKVGKIVFSDDSRHPLNELDLGQQVKVSYMTPEASRLAMRIDIQRLRFTGRIAVLDADKQLIDAGNLVASHTFQLSEDCKFVIPGKSDGSLEDLQIGDQATFVYENIDGVAVATKVILDAAGHASRDPAPASQAVARQ